MTTPPTLEQLTGLPRSTIEIIKRLENAEKILDVLINGSAMWGNYGLNGHFWCEMPDGKIIDDWFDTYDKCRSAVKINNKTLK